MSSIAPQTESARRYANYALGLLLVVYVFNHIDRQIMAILLDPVGRELGASDTQMGLLVGLAFALFYTFAGIPVARYADRHGRRDLIVIALAVWSGMTALCGVARSYAQLLVMRIGVGVGEAGCTPPAHSLISDYFPPERRAMALSIYALGVPIGTLFGLLAGGWISDFFGWRMAFMAVGLPGLLLAVIVRTSLREPPRGQFELVPDTGEAPPLGEVMRFIGSLPALRHVLIANSIQTLALAGAATWHPAFLGRLHGMSGGEIGTWLGFIAGFAGGAGVFGAGFLADRLGQRDPRWYVWIPALGALASIPFGAAFYLIADPTLALLCLIPATIFSNAYAALGHAVLQSLVKSRMRAVMSAVGLFAMNIVGFGLGPYLAGVLSDLFRPRFGEEGIRYALLALLVALAWCTLHYALAARTLARDLEAKNA